MHHAVGRKLSGNDHLLMSLMQSRYQETCLSPRCLIFLNGFAYFACSTMLWSEHIMAEVPGVAPIQPGANTLGKSGAAYPLLRYAEHVNAYTSRVLRYHSDALNAFAGIASAVARDLNYAGMRFGMPASVFDWAILWDTTRTQRSIQRRLQFPSWTWVDWKGIIHMPQDTYSLYDQKWLLKGTWIDWWRIDALGVSTGCGIPRQLRFRFQHWPRRSCSRVRAPPAYPRKTKQSLTWRKKEKRRRRSCALRTACRILPIHMDESYHPVSAPCSRKTKARQYRSFDLITHSKTPCSSRRSLSHRRLYIRCILMRCITLLMRTVMPVALLTYRLRIPTRKMTV